MPTRDTAWPDGTPCWVDCQVDDLDAARAFYSTLFGWEIEDGPDEAGGYLMATKDGKPAAGLGPKPMPTPSVWSTYLAASDVDATVTKAQAAGGTFLMPPFDVLDVGRMTFGLATDGSAYGLWQAGTHNGVGIYNEAGAVVWNELHTTDYPRAQTFYGEVFGYTFTEIGGGDFVYSTFALPGSEGPVGGFSKDTMKPAEAPNHWLVWFAVDDCDAAAAKATRLGGRLLMGPETTTFGRMSVVAAPQGETFGLIDMATTA